MAKIYMKRILAGIMTIEEVPARWQKQTQELLNAYYAEEEAKKNIVEEE